VARIADITRYFTVSRVFSTISAVIFLHFTGHRLVLTEPLRSAESRFKTTVLRYWTFCLSVSQSISQSINQSSFSL